MAKKYMTIGADKGQFDRMKYPKEINDKPVCLGSMLPAFHAGFILAKLRGYYTVKRWIGTDVWKIANCWWYRWEAWACNLFVDEHWFDAQWLKDDFIKVFPKENAGPVVSAEPWIYERKFNILIYIPKFKFRPGVDQNWRYGIDIIQDLRNKYPDWNWMIVDQFISKEIMSELFMRTDLYLRPSRYDGASRMVLFAKSIGVPVIFEPREDLKTEDIEPKVLEIYHQFKEKHK